MGPHQLVALAVRAIHPLTLIAVDRFRMLV
jgi:hypothetical protein